jgi:hypothetical protein
MFLAPQGLGAILKADSKMNGFCGKIVLITCLLACAGCASSSAIHKNLAVLQPGVPRLAIVGEFGQPLVSVTEQNLTTDVYGFYQGFKGLDRNFRTGMPDVGLEVAHEPDIEVFPEDFDEREPELAEEQADWRRRKDAFECEERRRCREQNEANKEAIAAQKRRRIENLRRAHEARLQQINLLALDHVPGFVGLGLSNPYDRPGSAGIVVFAVTYNEKSCAKFIDVTAGQKFVDQARKKGLGWFATKPKPLPSNDFFKNAAANPRQVKRVTTVSKTASEY